MSDDLVKRLYDRRVCSPAQNSCRNDLVLDQAADRIEELEAKLEKAIGWFNEIRQHCDNFGRRVPAIDERIVDRCEDTAANALAELKGQDE